MWSMRADDCILLRELRGRKRLESETAVRKKLEVRQSKGGIRFSYLSGFGDVIEQAGTHALGAAGVNDRFMGIMQNTLHHPFH
jgi:hypothetical protein